MSTLTYAGGRQETGDAASDTAPVETAAGVHTTDGPEVSRPVAVQYARHFTIEYAEKYLRMADKAKNIKVKPTVLNNAPYQGVWWIAGGSSYAARLIEDAGGDYMWSDNEQSGSLMLDFEAVFEKAADVDFWINPGIWRSLDEARAEDERYAEFKAFQKGSVYNNNRRMNEHGFSDYWESGVANPDVVLADLITIFHPDFLPGHELVYYKKLK